MVGGLQHHLRDFAHHPSILGLVASILTQFGIDIGTDKEGNFIIAKLEDNQYIGKTFGKKIYIATIVWLFHLISDMAGSSSSFSGGTGIPGVLVSTLKEMSSFPLFKEIKVKYKNDEIGLSIFISKLFNGTANKDENGNPIKLDFRTELGLVANQSKSVVINECMIRAIYSLRSFYKEIVSKDIKTIDDLKKINYKEVLPLKQRTLTRMLTISNGIFVLLDLSKATAKAVKMGSVGTFFLNINYVGIVRFVLACKDDSGYIEEDLRKELYNKYFGKDKSYFNFKLLDLNEEQMKILLSLELEKIKYDVLSIKNKEERKQKEIWCKNWKKQVLEGIKENEEYLMEDTNQLYKKLNKILKDNDKFYLIALELYLFKPY